MFQLNHKKYWFFIAITTIILVISNYSIVEGSNTQKQVILIIVNRLSFSDEQIYREISGFKVLNKFAAKGAMNINSAGSRNDANSYLSISGGAKGIGLKNEMGKSYLPNEIVNNNDTAGDIFRWNSGKKTYTDDSILFIPIEKLKNKVEQKYSFEPGILGGLLYNEKIRSKVFGNNDSDKKYRLAPLITMNKEGISFGNIGEETLNRDSTRPYGIKTNYNFLIDKWEESKKEEISLVVFDLGDLYRLDQYKNYMNTEQVKQVKEEILFEIGGFINYFNKSINSDQTLIVFSPMVNKKSVENKELLAPIWIYNKDNSGNTLISSTTRREGIVANIDIAPTIMNLLTDNETYQQMQGHDLKVIYTDIDFYKMLDNVFNIYDIRPEVLSNYILYQILILIIAIVFLFKKNKCRLDWLKILLLSTLFLPLLMLVTAKSVPNNPYMYLFILILISIVLGLIFIHFKPVTAFLILGLATYIALTVDIIFGCQMLKCSVLGYDPVIGARYYGIGNEYMGIYIGSTLLFISTLLESKKNNYLLFISAIILISTVFILAFPTLGTNAGGVLAIIATIIVFFLKEINISLWKKCIIFSLILFLLLVVFIICNLIVVGENQSHIGNALNQIIEGNYSSIFQTIKRKITMNIKLIHASSWSKIMFTAIISLIAISLRPKTKFNSNLKIKYPHMFIGFLSVFVGSVTALCVNDSGIVAASTMIIYVVVPMFYLYFNNKQSI